MSDREFAEGDVIIQQGGPGDYFYILASGTCDIFKDGARVLQVRDVSAAPPPCSFGTTATTATSPVLRHLLQSTFPRRRIAT